jgi:hypothetical protein
MNTNFISNTFSAFIIVMCLALSGFMLFTELFNDKMTESKRTIFVIVMITYATFRGFRLYQSIKASKK